MPLAIYRRHSTGCKFYGRPRRDSRSQNCKCPISVQGSLGREYLRRSLDLTSWQAAQDLVRGWEASGEVGVVSAEIPGIADASGGSSTTSKRGACPRRRSGSRTFCCGNNSCRGVGRADFHVLKQLGVDELTQFRTMWKDSPISTYKKQERLKGFFHFCVARDWIRTNPVAAIKPVKVPPSPTLPFDEKQMATILEACDRYPIRGIYNHGNRQRMNRDVIEFLRDENRVLKAQLHGAGHVAQ